MVQTWKITTRSSTVTFLSIHFHIGLNSAKNTTFHKWLNHISRSDQLSTNWRKRKTTKVDWSLPHVLWFVPGDGRGRLWCWRCKALPTSSPEIWPEALCCGRYLISVLVRRLAPKKKAKYFLKNYKNKHISRDFEPKKNCRKKAHFDQLWVTNNKKKKKKKKSNEKAKNMEFLYNSVYK